MRRPAVSTQTHRLTYEKYLKTPEIKARFDIVDGVMTIAPTPTVGHQKILRQLFSVLYQVVSEQHVGEVFFAPVDVIIQREPLRTRQPDLLFVSNEHTSILGDQVDGPPDLVAEILSPSNTRSDLEEKLADYATLGVQECWLVSPEAGSVEVLVLTDETWVRQTISGLGDWVQSQVLPELNLEVAQLFE
jgi:Uma2 family endonuclease